MILVVGSTGLLGGEICRQLAQKDQRFRALVRTTSASDKVGQLQQLGGELFIGDLKDPGSLDAACQGVQTVISTASSTFVRQEGDSIQSVDHDGQLALVEAAEKAGVQQFIYVSFPPTPDFPNALDDAKRAVEHRLRESNMPWTSLQANYFMEIWLSPAVGFDFPNKMARLYGEGTAKISWVSYQDVARFAAACIDNPVVYNRVLSIGGPEALSPLEVVDIFASRSGAEFQIEKIPVAALQSQWENADDPLNKAFAGLMLTYAHGWDMPMEAVCGELGVGDLESVENYAFRSLGV